MKEEEYFTIESNSEFTVTVTYGDDSKKNFNRDDWYVYRKGIKANLYDKGLIKSLSINYK
jgi:hypothetical protein